jgi:hypothetical protein
MKRYLLATCLAAALMTARAGAITVVPMTFEQLVGESEAVVYARVSEVKGQWTSDRRSIESVIRLEALRYLKGDWGDSVFVRLPGGAAGGRISVLPGAPQLREGDLVVLFLDSRGPSIPTVLGLNQGVFRVAPDARTGAPMVSPPPLKASEAGRIVRGAAERRRLTVEAFAAAVRGLEVSQ